LNYKLAYRIGFHPWEDAEDQPELVDQVSELLAREENGDGPPHGRALDLGCGSAIWGIHMARRGWDVTGVDIVEKALDRGRSRVEESGQTIQLVHGDVTDLERSGVGSDFRLVLDTGTFHGLRAPEREAMGRGLDAITTPDASVLLMAWPPRWRGPAIRGVSRADIESAFPAWEITDEQPSAFEVPKPLELLLKPDERWYRLQRRA
jgi:SAM-dependent methyltransferase